MSLYACCQCCRVERTDLGYYHEAIKLGKPVLCSECHTGKWHNKFPIHSAAGMYIFHDGWLSYDLDVIPHVMKIHGTIQYNARFPYYPPYVTIDPDAD